MIIKSYKYEVSLTDIHIKYIYIYIYILISFKLNYIPHKIHKYVILEFALKKHRELNILNFEICIGKISH